MDPPPTPLRKSRQRLPRPRGDGPLVETTSGGVTTAPPPTRGWTRSWRSAPPKPSGSPAHAGMDPDTRAPHPLSPRLPRPRGDGPCIPPRDTSTDPAPPPTRGWTRLASPEQGEGQGSPAHAGMDPAGQAAYEAYVWLPRPRGDGPLPLVESHDGWEAPPPTRGWTARHRGPPGPHPGSPAHAGMDPRRSRRPAPGSGLPRPRGDGPMAMPAARALLAAPPPTRGWTPGMLNRTGITGGSPAHAGMDRISENPARCWLGLPRPRGDGPHRLQNHDSRTMAPPPTRGWTPGPALSGTCLGGSPAHAGMDPPTKSHQGTFPRLPRPRGDGPRRVTPSPVGRAAPPPTRGWTREYREAASQSRGSPAHAGMDPVHSRSPCPRSRLPRPRGDGPTSRNAANSTAAAPPPTRGWTVLGYAGIIATEGSPTHAGMDPFDEGKRPPLSRLPRPRGDGPQPLHFGQNPYVITSVHPNRPIEGANRIRSVVPVVCAAVAICVADRRGVAGAFSPDACRLKRPHTGLPERMRTYVDAPLVGKHDFERRAACGSGTVVCPASRCSHSRPRACMVFVRSDPHRLRELRGSW